MTNEPLAYPQKFIGYLRVSTGRQGASGLGLEAQKAAVHEHIQRVSGKLVDEYVEVESGKLRDRPVLAKALAHCRRVGATLIIAKLDRLARNVAFISSLMESRTDFLACDFPAANKLMLHILAAFAEHEAQQIGLRTRAALAAAKARGVKLGSYGAVLAARRQSEAAAYADSLRDTVLALVQRNMTLQSIADQLNGLGLVTREGAAWCPTTVRRVLIRLGLHPQSKPAAKAAKGLTTLSPAPGTSILRHHDVGAPERSFGRG